MGVLKTLSFSDCNLMHKTSIIEKFEIDICAGDQRSEIEADTNANVTSIYLDTLILDKLQLNIEFKN